MSEEQRLREVIRIMLISFKMKKEDSRFIFYNSKKRNYLEVFIDGSSKELTEEEYYFRKK